MNLSFLVRNIEPAAFLAPATLEERASLVMRTLNARIDSQQLAQCWVEWLAAHVATIDAESTELLLREALVMSPMSPRNEELLAMLMRMPKLAEAAHGVVFMVTSCRKYLAQAMRVQQQLAARGATACIIIGDSALRVARWDGDLCILPVEDSYEALAHKVAAGVTAVVRRFGLKVAVVKIDDDTHLTESFSVERFAQLAASFDYVGSAFVAPNIDRFWHIGKTQRPLGPYARRYHGPWATGACYLLSSRSAGLVAREHMMYPAEFADEFYEDKAVGDFLRRQGIHVHALSYQAMGVSFDAAERFVTSPVQADVQPLPDTPASAADAAIPKLLHVVWVGDEAQRPDNLISTWAERHPGWTVKIWGNEDLATGPWQCAEQLLALQEHGAAAVATLMKWEILLREGGVAVAADSLCLRPLDEAWLALERFTCWLNEEVAPGLLCADYFGCRPGDGLVALLLQEVRQTARLAEVDVSEAVGCARLTAVYRAMADEALHVMPSHTFLPCHPQAQRREVAGGVYACELWATTLGIVPELSELPVDALRLQPALVGAVAV